MSNNGNPAQRLYDIVIAAKKFYIQSGSHTPVSWSIWAKVFTISDSDNFSRDEELEIISCVEQSRKLVDEVESHLILNEDINQEIYLRPFPKLRELFTSPFKLNWGFNEHFKLGDSDITALEFGIDAVSKVYKEKIVDETELQELLSEIQELYEQIIKLDIDKKLKKTLLDMLKIMQDAIHEYRIRGVERLREAIEQLIGIYIFNKETFDNSNIKEVGKVKKLFGRFGFMYSTAADTIQLLGAGEVIKNTGEFITKLLGSG